MQKYGLSECETPLCSSTRDLKPIPLPPVWMGNRGWVTLTLDVCEACQCLDGPASTVMAIRATLPPRVLPKSAPKEEGVPRVADRAVA